MSVRANSTALSPIDSGSCATLSNGMTAPEPTIEHLSALLREAHARVWDKKGRHQPESTDADYQEWLKAWERVESARTKARLRLKS